MLLEEDLEEDKIPEVEWEDFNLYFKIYLDFKEDKSKEKKGTNPLTFELIYSFLKQSTESQK